MKKKPKRVDRGFRDWLGRVLFNLIKDDLEIFLWAHPQDLNHRPRFDKVSWRQHRSLPGHLEVVYALEGERDIKKCSLPLPRHLTNEDVIRDWLLKHPQNYI